MKPPIRAYVRYHSHQWETLVEAGWRTLYVEDDGVAVMTKDLPELAGREVFDA